MKGNPEAMSEPKCCVPVLCQICETAIEFIG